MNINKLTVLSEAIEEKDKIEYYNEWYMDMLKLRKAFAESGIIDEDLESAIIEYLLNSAKYIMGELNDKPDRLDIFSELGDGDKSMTMVPESLISIRSLIEQFRLNNKLASLLMDNIRVDLEKNSENIFFISVMTHGLLTTLPFLIEEKDRANTGFASTYKDKENIRSYIAAKTISGIKSKLEKDDKITIVICDDCIATGRTINSVIESICIQLDLFEKVGDTINTYDMIDIIEYLDIRVFGGAVEFIYNNNKKKWEMK